MNYKEYNIKKQDERMELIAAGGGYAIAKKRWNAETGEPIEPEIVAVDTDELEARKVELQSEINSIDDVLADINSLSNK